MFLDTKITDNSQAVLDALYDQLEDVLAKIGEDAVEDVKAQYEKEHLVDTGDTKESFHYKTDKEDNAVYVGSNRDSALFVEYGTGHYTKSHHQAPYGTKAHHILKRTVAKNAKKYVKAIKKGLEK